MMTPDDKVTAPVSGGFFIIVRETICLFIQRKTRLMNRGMEIEKKATWSDEGYHHDPADDDDAKLTEPVSRLMGKLS
jgi:hypothetical protein